MIVPGSVNPLLLAGSDENTPIVAPDGCCSLDPYTVSGSVRFRNAASAKLERTPTVAGPTNGRQWTVSMWVKRGSNLTAENCLLSTTTGSYEYVWFQADGTMMIQPNMSGASISTGKYLDTTAWYHMVFVVDLDTTTQDKLRFYVNGIKQTISIPNPSYGTRNWNMPSSTNAIGYCAVNGTRYADVYIAEFHNIDGQALDATAFGEFCLTSSQWNPKKYAGTYGTNGAYLKFDDPAQIGKDSSGNNNHWTPHNIDTAAPGTQATYDVMKDSPSRNAALGVGNYAVWGNNLYTNATTTLRDGNLVGDTNSRPLMSSIGSGNAQTWVEISPISNAGNSQIAIFPYPTGPSQAIYYRTNGQAWLGGSVVGSGSGGFTTNDWIGAAFDRAARTCGIYVNGTKVYEYTGLLNEAYTVGFDQNSLAGGSVTAVLNAGQRPWHSPPPAGYLSTSTANLDDTALPTGIRCARGAIT